MTSRDLLDLIQIGRPLGEMADEGDAPAAQLAVQRWVDRVEIRSRIGAFEMAEAHVRVGMVDRRDFDLRLVEAASSAGVDVREATIAGLAAGLVFGIQDALTRQTLEILQGHPVTVLLTNWPPYCLLGAGIVGLVAAGASVGR